MRTLRFTRGASLLAILLLGAYGAATGDPSKANKTLVVTVTDPAGHPLPRARGLVVSIDGQDPGMLEFLTGKLDFEIREGKASVELPWKPATLRVYAAADARGNPLALSPQEGVSVKADAVATAIRLEAGVAIEGSVVDAKGVAVEGATVEARGKPRVWDPKGNEVGSTLYGSAISGIGGAFHLIGLGRTTYRLVVRLKSGELGTTTATEVEGGSAKVKITVGLARAKRVQVTDRKDRPAVGAHVSVLLLSQTPHWMLFTAEADKDGYVTLPPLDPEHEPNTYELEVRPPSDRDDLTFFRSVLQDTADVTIVLGRGFVIRGIVHDASGAPVRAMVHAASAFENKRTPVLGSPVETKDDGSFEVRGVPFQPAQVQAVPLGSIEGTALPGGEWTDVTPDHATVSLVLAKSGR